MRYSLAGLLIVVAGFATAGEDLERKPDDISKYVVLYFWAPGSRTVDVFKVGTATSGIGHTDYVPIPGPVYLSPGKVYLNFNCPNASKHPSDTSINLPNPGTYYVACADNGNLLVHTRPSDA